MVSKAESVPDQVGDVLRAKHAGSRVVLPTGSAALCHLPSWLVCALWRVWAVSGSGESRNPSWCQINTGSGVACPATKQIGKRWEALGGERRETAGHESVWAVNSPSVFFSLSFTPLPLFQQPCWQTEPLHQPNRQWGFEVARGSESLLVISPLLSTRSVVPFQASASLSRQDYIQSHDHCWDFKAPFNGQDNAIKQTQLDDRGGLWEEKQGQMRLSEDSSKHMFASSKHCSNPQTCLLGRISFLLFLYKFTD